MAFGGCADKLILFPTTHREFADTAMERTVPLGRGQLQIWTDRSPGAQGREPQAYVLEFVGNAARAEYVATYAAQRWGEHPVEVWAVNYPGYGGSTGPARLAAIPPAALAAYDELARGAGGKPILVAGNSIGTAAALHVAANRPVRGLILQNPPPLRSLILREFGWWNLWLLATPVAMGVPDELDSVKNAARVEAPAVFLLAEQDEIVPPKYHKMVVDAYAGPKRLIPVENANHNSPVEGVALRKLEEAMRWLLSQEP